MHSFLVKDALVSLCSVMWLLYCLHDIITVVVFIVQRSPAADAHLTNINYITSSRRYHKCWLMLPVCRCVVAEIISCNCFLRPAAKWHRLLQSRSSARSWILLRVNGVFIDAVTFGICFICCITLCSVSFSWRRSSDIVLVCLHSGRIFVIS